MPDGVRAGSLGAAVGSVSSSAVSACTGSRVCARSRLDRRTVSRAVRSHRTDTVRCSAVCRPVTRCPLGSRRSRSRLAGSEPSSRLAGSKAGGGVVCSMAPHCGKQVMQQMQHLKLQSSIDDRQRLGIQL